MAEQHSKDIEARLRAGIEAARSGEITKARAILSKVVLEKPRSVHAWWYLGQVVEDTNQRIYCYKKVLNLDPSHAGARAKLGLQPWDKKRNAPAPPGASASRSRQQRRILLILTILTLFVLIVGGGYIYLDTSGMLPQLLTSPTEVPSATPVPVQASPTSAAISLSTIPTWTPTPSPSPRPTEPPPTPTSAFTPTLQPPTPESLPNAALAQVFDLASGTGVIVIEPGAYFVMRFEPEPEFNLETIGTLLFHAIPSDPETDATLELYIQEILEGSWQMYGVNWGDNSITDPGQLVNQDGAIVAALRNWGTETLTLDNAGFTLAALDASGAEIYYGLTRQEIIEPVEPTPTSTRIDYD
jgi:hypothetical protein